MKAIHYLQTTSVKHYRVNTPIGLTAREQHWFIERVLVTQCHVNLEDIAFDYVQHTCTETEISWSLVWTSRHVIAELNQQAAQIGMILQQVGVVGAEFIAVNLLPWRQHLWRRQNHAFSAGLVCAVGIGFSVANAVWWYGMPVHVTSVPETPTHSAPIIRVPEKKHRQREHSVCGRAFWQQLWRRSLTEPGKWHVNVVPHC